MEYENHGVKKLSLLIYEYSLKSQLYKDIYINLNLHTC